MKLKTIIPAAFALLLTACGIRPIEPRGAEAAVHTSAAQTTTEAGTTTHTSDQTTDHNTTDQTTDRTTESPETTAAAAETESEWMLRLANKTHPVGEYAPPELTTLKNKVQVDARMYPALQKMYDDMRAAGLSPYTREGYRTYAAQVDIMKTRIQSYLSQGYSQTRAEALAKEYVAEPGTSEHQLGLAVDINSTDGNNWPVYNWLAVHAQEYGFILRYPEGGKDITGYAYEPWHYRYVGKQAALEIFQAKTTLEEYLGEAETLKAAS